MRNQSYLAAVCAALLVGLVGLPRSVWAVTVFSQPPVNNSNAFGSDNQLPQQQADNFSLGSAASITSARWWGSYPSAAPAAGNNFLVRFFSDVAGSPAVNPFYDQSVVATRTNTALVDNIGDPVFEYSV